MVAINYANREVSCKIVYYGPGLSGKTTNLQYIHGKVPQTTRGDLISLATDADRTLYFDFLPINIGTINGFTTRFQLYTVPGQVFYNATRKLVLRGVDGLIFVADSQRDKADENVESYNNLKENLAEYGYKLNSIPMVMQYNKRDLPDVMSIDELQKLLNEHNWPFYEGVAHKGKGVFDTLKLIIKMILERAKKSGTAQKIEEVKKAQAVKISPAVESPPQMAESSIDSPVARADVPEAGYSESTQFSPASAPRIESIPRPAAVHETAHLAASAESTGEVATLDSPDVRNESAEENPESGHESDLQVEDRTELSCLSGGKEPQVYEHIIKGEPIESSENIKDSAGEIIAEPDSRTNLPSGEKPLYKKAVEESGNLAGRKLPESEASEEDIFALPSDRPRMATSRRAISKAKKKFFLFRWLFGGK